MIHSIWYPRRSKEKEKGHYYFILCSFINFCHRIPEFKISWILLYSGFSSAIKNRRTTIWLKCKPEAPKKWITQTGTLWLILNPKYIFAYQNLVWKSCDVEMSHMWLHWGEVKKYCFRDVFTQSGTYLILPDYTI